MKVSIYATANRPSLWLDFHRLISRNDIELEIVFCGNVDPTFPLPSNFHFIHSDFKPAQCQAIAASKCTGELMMNGVDDFEYTPTLFDRAATLFQSEPTPGLCVLPKMTSDGHGIDRDFTHEHWRLIDNDLNSPQIPQQAVFRRSFFEYLGGYSKIFIGSAQDQDLSMRMLRAAGYRLHIMPDDKAIEHCQPADSNSLYHRIGRKERMLLTELWIEGGDRPHGFGGTARVHAAGPHQPYNMPTIETVAQGPSVAFILQQNEAGPEWQVMAGQIARGEVTP